MNIVVGYFVRPILYKVKLAPYCICPKSGSGEGTWKMCVMSVQLKLHGFHFLIIAVLKVPTMMHIYQPEKPAHFVCYVFGSLF